MNGKPYGTSGEMIRAFIAIELDRTVLKALDKLQGELIRTVPGGVVRWTKTSGIHLTLKFLGDVPSGKIPEIEQGLRRACRGFDPFELVCSGLGCFPYPAKPRVIWVGVEEPTGALVRLQKAVERDISPLGYPAESRPFSPHLTLGRSQHGASTDELKLLGDLIVSRRPGKLAEMEVTAVNLMRSELRPSGATYTSLASVVLGG